MGADTLRYLSIGGLRRSMGDPEGGGFCFACFTGDYPVPVPLQLEMDKQAMEHVEPPPTPAAPIPQLS